LNLRCNSYAFFRTDANDTQEKLEDIEGVIKSRKEDSQYYGKRKRTERQTMDDKYYIGTKDRTTLLYKPH